MSGCSGYRGKQMNDTFASLRCEVVMTTITIALPEERLQRLKEIASRLGVAPEELVQASLEDLLTRFDQKFEQAADYVLKKNAELYRRLA
jgi:predicted transcriptional regulator